MLDSGKHRSLLRHRSLPQPRLQFLAELLAGLFNQLVLKLSRAILADGGDVLGGQLHQHVELVLDTLTLLGGEPDLYGFRLPVVARLLNPLRLAPHGCNDVAGGIQQNVHQHPLLWRSFRPRRPGVAAELGGRELVDIRQKLLPSMAQAVDDEDVELALTSFPDHLAIGVDGLVLQFLNREIEAVGILSSRAALAVHQGDRSADPGCDAQAGERLAAAGRTE